MMKKYTIVFSLLSLVMSFTLKDVAAQKATLVTVESVVKDENGNPIADAEVFAGAAYARTDADGQFSIKIPPNTSLTIEAEGYDQMFIPSEDVFVQREITMNSSDIFYTTDDNINIAFGKAHRGDVAGAVSVVDPTDIAGYENNIFANGLLSGRTLGMLGSNSIRGVGIGIDVSSLTGSGPFSGNALYIVDGLPRDIGYIRASEIESITVLKDVNAAMLYGSAAINGVVLITTKRGEAFKDKSRFTVNYGVSTPRALPKYLNSADYMTYFNQARTNDGLEAQYDADEIQNHRTGNKYRYPDVDYYSDEYLKSHKTYFDVVGEFSGGNENAKYYTNLGWNSSGGLLNFGQGADARNNIFNVRGNVDLKVNDWISTALDAYAVFVLDKDHRGNFWGNAASLRPNLYSPLLPIDLVNPEDEVLAARKREIAGGYLLGGNSGNLNSPLGDGIAGGVLERIERNFAFNNRINFDLERIAKGLSFHTNISFDQYIRYHQTIANEYAVYEPTWDDAEDRIIELKKHGVDASRGEQVVGNTFFRRRFGFSGQLTYDKVISDVHHLTTSLVGYGSNFKQEGDFQGVKQAHLGVRASYVFNRKYMADFSGAYVNSVKLAEGNRTDFSPSLGLAWMISSEDFMSSASNVDALKLRVSAGILNSDLPIGGFFYYDTRYQNSGSYNWFEGGRSRSGVMSNWNGNPDLGFAKRKDVNVGIEGLFFDKMLGFEANAFYDLYSDLITRPNTIYPSFYSDFIPYENFGADEYKGLEAGLNFNKSAGDWSFFVGVNALYVTSQRKKVDETYVNAYQYRQGRPVDATFGLEAVGLFQDEADIANSPLQAFGAVAPGDIKYKDQNGDNIVDGNDEVYLRRWQAPLSGGLQVRVGYKNLTLFVLGQGASGADGFREGDYFWVDGNNKYSEVVRGAWTPETAATATHPRLSSVTNSNNHRRSTYWRYSTDYFQIRSVQLTYDFPEAVTRQLRMKDLHVFVNGSDLFRFAKNREIMDLRVGAEPFYRTFSAGLKANF